MKWFWHKVMPYIVVASFFAAMYLWRSASIAGLKQHGMYTIGHTTGYWHTAAGAKKLSFEFDVDGVRCYNSSGNHHLFELHRRYFVRFDSTNAQNSELLKYPAVPDTLVHIPAGGWTSLPVQH
ncbi:MAG: hypothetical protein H6591_08970 [Flavobacteriales bacterium]|nr:hypothetical protein [Flavobacteriales bacterium]